LFITNHVLLITATKLSEKLSNVLSKMFNVTSSRWRCRWSSTAWRSIIYVCTKIYVRAAADSLDCHEGAMVNCRLYRTFQSLSVNRTETVTSSCREQSVVVSSTVLDQSTRNFVVHSSWSCSNWWQGILSLLNVAGEWCDRNTQFRQIDTCCLVQALVYKHTQLILYTLLNWKPASAMSRVL